MEPFFNGVNCRTLDLLPHGCRACGASIYLVSGMKSKLQNLTHTTRSAAGTRVAGFCSMAVKLAVSD